jgi:hypothetical protein
MTSGKKTHDQFDRVIQRQSGLHRGHDGDGSEGGAKRAKREARQSEFPVSEHGMNQESSQNKHNHPPKGAPKH